MADKSQNNFMYLRHVLSDIAEEKYLDLELEKLPTGLENYYEDQFERMIEKKSEDDVLQLKIAYILANLNRPLTLDQICKYLQQEDLQVREKMYISNLIKNWKQFLTVYRSDNRKQDRYSIYHNSFRDFLRQSDSVQVVEDEISPNFFTDIYKQKVWVGEQDLDKITGKTSRTGKSTRIDKIDDRKKGTVLTRRTSIISLIISKIWKVVKPLLLLIASKIWSMIKPLIDR